MKNVVGLIVVVMLLVGGYFFWKSNKQNFGTATDNQMTELNTYSKVPPSYHPDSVVGFKWTVKDQVFEFQRESREDPWDPSVTSQNLQDRLNAISLLHNDSKVHLGPIKVEVEIFFGPDHSWKGGWDGSNFAWLEGAKKGAGSTPPPELNELFEAGMFSFDKKEIQWCRARLKNLEYSFNGTKYHIGQEGLKWMQFEPQKVEIDPTFAEKWLGKYCTFVVTSFFDPSIANIGVSDLTQTLKIEFVNNEIVEIPTDGKHFLFSDRILSSEEWQTALEELANAPKI